MAFNFPDTTGQPTDGTFIYQVAGLVYSWDGTSWVAAGAGASAVDTSVFEVVNATPNGAGSLAYAPATGTFTFTPPDTSQYLTDYGSIYDLSLIHISEPTRRRGISYAVFCLKKKIIY